MVSTNEDKIRKTDAQRQKSLYKRRTSQGWRKGWIDPGTLDLAARLGGIENVPDAYVARMKAEAELESLQSRPWWRIWGR